MLKVIVVEDAYLLRKGLIFTIDWESMGCQVIGDVSNGIDGVDIILRLKPHIVITDIRLPGMNGLEMMKVVKDKSDAKFIIISGYSEFEYAQQAVKLGAIDYLIKPVDDRLLMDALQRACEAVRRDNLVNKLQTQFSNIEDSKLMLFKEYMAIEPSTKSEYVNKTIKYIIENYSKDIRVKDIADSMQLSESHLSRIFKEETSYTIVDYITYYRIKKACSLLMDQSSKVYEVSEKVGYKDQRYFSVIFKQMVGITPTEFKEGKAANIS
ncbi:MAG TPA: response regulator [Clostridiaceae bacterium]|nr:response regulator [Clostridiaceae bacterium]